MGFAATKRNEVPSVTDPIPEHLLPYVAQQDPSLYTPIDHASWRFIMHLSQRFFKDHAHRKYLDGLAETGISTERIPLIDEMDHKLRRFGWRAVAVVGFIPPSVFLEFQSHGILVIACDMRRLENLAYTPSPDIVHEAAGHAPIVADPEFRDFLRGYGEVARNAIFTKRDLEIYDAIRDLSDLKEDPKTTPAQIDAAQKHFEALVATSNIVSEAAQLSRMTWWTTEYGLIGDMKSPLIYGAGLLSSVGESFHCFDSNVKKIPLTLSCIEQGYDITRPQPQLYVTPDFATLSRVLEELASTMAYRKGGVFGLEKAKQAETTTTTVLDSGLQISSVLSKFELNEKGDPVYLQYAGPTQLAYKDHELPEQGPKHHAEGFGTPVGKVMLPSGKWGKPQELKLKPGEATNLEFESGVELKGHLEKSHTLDGKTLVMTFSNCTVTYKGQTLFKPEWGTFDMACGETISSVFGGAADRSRFMKALGNYKQRPASQKTNATPETRELEPLYAKVREIRESGKNSGLAEKKAELARIRSELDQKFSDDWLLRFELLELNKIFGLQAEWAPEVLADLGRISKGSSQTKELIGRALELLK